MKRPDGPAAPDQVLTAAQMLGAEQSVMMDGHDVHELMQRAGHGAARWVWRVAAGAPVTVLCGSGNNGGDGYVIAQALHERGFPTCVVAAMPPATDAARRAAALYEGPVAQSDTARGAVLVDCLFGSGLDRAVTGELREMLLGLAARHDRLIAVDLPSGVQCDSGAILLAGLPHYDLCLALGAWKRAHFLMPSAAHWRDLRLVDIGCDREPGGARLVTRPAIAPPDADAHKYTRGMVAIVGGEMAGAAVLAAHGAAHGGAGYVKLLSMRRMNDAPPWLVTVKAPGDEPLGKVAGEDRVSALLIGPGLGRGAKSHQRLGQALSLGRPMVIDADALTMLRPGWMAGDGTLILTPHAGEMAAMEVAFDLSGDGTRPDRAAALAQATGAHIIAKGADTVIAAPDGALVFNPRASSWLSVAGTGDVLAGLVAARLAVTGDAMQACEQAVWLHGEAARRAGAAFTAEQLAQAVRSALGAAT